MKKVFLIITGLLFFICSPALPAEEAATIDNYKLEEIVVTTTKTQSRQSEIAASVTIITAEDIERSGKMNVLEILRNVPGVSVMQYGGFGGSSSVYLRGTKPGHTLVLLDGIELNDAMVSDRSFDFAYLLADNIERIEIVRGAQSTLYGSDAMGGVINIITKKGKGKPKWEVFAEAGSYNTFKESTNVKGSYSNLDYSLSASRLDTGGTSKAAGGKEKDEYENTTFSSNLGLALFENVKLDLVFRSVDAQYDYDDGGNQDDPNKVGWWKNKSGKAAFEQQVFPAWTYTVSYGHSETKREYKDDPDAVDVTENSHNWFEGKTRKLEWQNDIQVTDKSLLTIGYDNKKEKGSADGIASWNKFSPKSMKNQGYFAQNMFKFQNTASIVLGVRLDDNDSFGKEATYKISGASPIPKTGLRLKANWGTGFKAPSLYQLNSPSYGNPDLKPDEGETYDIGLEQFLFNDQIYMGITYFHNEFENMVEWDSTIWTYQNIDNAQMKGIEVESSFRVSQNFSIGANYTLTKAKDKDTDKELARRPKHQASVSLNWGLFGKGNVNLSASHVGKRWDDGANTEELDAYNKVDVNTIYDVTKKLSVFARFENLFDKGFQQAHGYESAGVSVYGGVKASF